jgi:hypothetical protein
MTKRDFSILFEKVSTTSGTKDIALVKGFNAYSQYIENVCKTQKGEVISDLNLGSDYYSYIFDGKANKGELETAMASYIAASIKNIFNVKVVLKYSTETLFQFVITYDISDGISKISNASTFIEVEL